MAPTLLTDHGAVEVANARTDDAGLWLPLADSRVA